jgi:hypothetical protein
VLTDAVGFTERMRQNEPAALRLLAEHQQVFTKEFAAHQGQIIKSTGDGYLVVFGSAVDAVLACQEIQSQLQDSELRHRIGIDVGEVTLTETDAYGDVVNICSRLEGLANPGEILISRDVWSMVKSQGLNPPSYIGPRVIKGSSEPIPIHSWQYGTAPKRRKVLNIPVIVASAILCITLFVGASRFPLEALSKPDSNDVIQQIRSRRTPVASASKSEANNDEAVNADVELIMDEAYAQVLEELEAFEIAKAEAIEKLDARIVLTWLEQNPYGERERGKLEYEHWKLVDLAIQKGKQAVGAKANATEILKTLGRSSDPADQLAHKALMEEVKN